MGIYLAQRRDNESGVNLCHCADEGRGFYVEVGIDNGREQAMVLRSLSSSVPLEDSRMGCGCRSGARRLADMNQSGG